MNDVERTVNLEFKIEVEALVDRELSSRDVADIISEQWTISDALNVNHEGVYLRNVIILEPEILN